MSRVLVVTPAASGSRSGNRITAERYGRLLDQEGHAVEIAEDYTGQPCDVLIALHARRSAPAVVSYREAHPMAPLVVVLTGTDLYHDLPAGDADALRSVELADRLIVLHPRGAGDVPASARAKAHTAVQSVELPEAPVDRPQGVFQVCVLSHLRAVKDPLRAAEAARSLPAKSKLQIVHMGGVLDPELGERARIEQQENPRYRWLDELPHAEVKRVLASSHLHVLTSVTEGGANALCEAIACGVPTICTRMAASIGILGADYPGFFPVGDTEALAELLRRAEKDSSFRHGLRRWCSELKDLVTPASERAALRRVFAGLVEGEEPPRLHIARGNVIDGAAELVADVRDGLSADAKHLHCRFFYDEAGSQLFEEICDLPEYYLTRAETEILQTHAAEIPGSFGHDAVLFELGSGSGVKTRLVIEAFLQRGHSLTYAPVDISRTALEATARAFSDECPDLRVHAIQGEYACGIRWLNENKTGERLVAYLGSNLGNFDREAAVTFLLSVRSAMTPRDRLLIGIDLRKDHDALVAAYDDSQGVTARFNRNLLVRINAELGGHFDPDAFDHVARYDTDTGCVSMHLKSRAAQTVRIDALDLEVSFAAGEEIHTEDSYKYSLEEIATLAEDSGFRVDTQWLDTEERFSLSLFAPEP